MPLPTELSVEFQRFESLPVSDETSAERKRIVRSLQSAVQNQSLALTEAEFRQCRDGEATVGRILAYLYVEADRVKDALVERRSYVVAEWERLQHAGFPAAMSTMPLYYAIRAYLTHLKNTPEARVGAQADEELFLQIADVLPRRGLDGGGQIQGAVKQIVALLDRSRDAQATPALAAAMMTRRGAIIAATITASGALLVGLMTNWDKFTGAADDRESQANVLPSTPVPFQTGWIFVGYYDSAKRVYIEGPYAEVGFRATGTERGPLIPALGDVMHVIKDRRVIIANFKTEGVTHQLTSPPLVNDILTDVDETGVMFPQGTLLIVRDVEVSGYQNRPDSVWIRVAACDAQTPACERARTATTGSN